MLPLRLAFRFLTAGKAQTILIIAGIAVAVSVQVFVGLLINSLQQTIIDRTIGHAPHITIKSDTDTAYIKDWRTIVSKVKLTGLADVISVVEDGNGFLIKSTKIKPILIRGFEPESADRIYGIRSAIYSGKWDTARKDVLVGRELQQDLDYSLGDEILLSINGGAPVSYRISGFFDLGVAELNTRWIIIDIAAANTLLGGGDQITSIELKVADLFAADLIAQEITAELNNPNLKIDNWKGQNQQLLSGLQGQSISSFMIQIFIILSVVIAVASILAITVFQKSRQIGILKAMGIKDTAASLIFIYEGLLMGFIGATLGVALGLSLLFGFSSFTSQPGMMSLIDLYIDYRFVILSWGIAMVSAAVAGLIPAWRSLRLNPVDVIREG